MSIAVPLYGFGTGGGGYTGPKVIGSPTQPSNPKDNTVWVQTSTPISSWEMSVVAVPGWDTAPAGFVYFTMDTSDWTVPNLVKFTKGSVGNVFLKATRCWQNLGVPGATQWKGMNAYVYHNNTWVQFSSPRNTPEFTYTGDYAIVDDNDNAISDFATWTGNWKIRFLTSGTLTFTNLNGVGNSIDVFLVGGGADGKTGSTYWAGSSGGGGYTTTAKNITVSVNTPYSIVVGASGGTSSGFNKTAAGGKQGGGAVSADTTRGGAGGSGGTPAFHVRGDGTGKNLYGGTDGGNSGSFSISHNEVGGTITCAPGIGQGTTTREFGENGGELYSSGGNAYGHSSPTVANSGNGGSGSSVKPSSGNPTVAATKGSSGIVIIRNKR